MAQHEHDSVDIPGVGKLTPGTLFSLKNSHGRYTFSSYVVNDETGKEWIEAFGGIANHKQFRAIRKDQVRRIEKKRE